VRAAALGALLAAASAGCAGLPSSSSVMPGDPVAAPLSTPLRMHPVTPIPGAGPELIVKGFLVAGSALSYDDPASGPTVSKDYRPAREFLTPAVSEGWAPGSRSAVLYTGAVKATVAQGDQDNATVHASVEAVATLAADGRYVELPEPQQRTIQVELYKVEGEWRIAHLPADFGLWLDQFYFNRSYQPFSVTYASPIARTLIPDRRFFPITSGLPTALARAQLEPIPTYLQGAVTTGFPANTRLSVESVSVTGGTARLDLTIPTTSSAEDRRAALAQSIATLTQATSVAGVSLRADGRPLELVGVAGPPYDLAGLGYEKAQGPEPEVAVVRTQDRLVAVRPADPRKVAEDAGGVQLPRIDPTYSKLAVGPGLRDFAAVTGDGAGLIRHRQRGDTPAVGYSAVQAPFATGLVRPAFDSHQGLWLAGAAPSGAPTIWVIDTRGELGTAQPVPIGTPWLAGQRVVALKVAPDAQRVALLLRQADGRVRIGVSGVVRGQDQRVSSLTAPLYVGGGLLDAVDLTWTTAYRLTVLARGAATAELRATYVDLDGRAEGSELGAVPGARAIAALGGGRVGVVTTAGRLLISVAGYWQDAGPASDIVVP
jgi:hypothetical protein